MYTRLDQMGRAKWKMKHPADAASPRFELMCYRSVANRAITVRVGPWSRRDDKSELKLDDSVHVRVCMYICVC